MRPRLVPGVNVSPIDLTGTSTRRCRRPSRHRGQFRREGDVWELYLTGVEDGKEGGPTGSFTAEMRQNPRQRRQGVTGSMSRNPLPKNWSGRPDSNRRRPAWEAGILPLNYGRPATTILQLFQ
jgi:hypothetical protein